MRTECSIWMHKISMTLRVWHWNHNTRLLDKDRVDQLVSVTWPATAKARSSGIAKGTLRIRSNRRYSFRAAWVLLLTEELNVHWCSRMLWQAEATAAECCQQENRTDATRPVCKSSTSMIKIGLSFKALSRLARTQLHSTTRNLMAKTSIWTTLFQMWTNINSSRCSASSKWMVQMQETCCPWVQQTPNKVNWAISKRHQPSRIRLIPNWLRASVAMNTEIRTCWRRLPEHLTLLLATKSRVRWSCWWPRIVPICRADRVVPSEFNQRRMGPKERWNVIRRNSWAPAAVFHVRPGRSTTKLKKPMTRSHLAVISAIKRQEYCNYQLRIDLMMHKQALWVPKAKSLSWTTKVQFTSWIHRTPTSVRFRPATRKQPRAQLTLQNQLQLPSNQFIHKSLRISRGWSVSARAPKTAEVDQN